jgi:hypothetical protein
MLENTKSLLTREAIIVTMEALYSIRMEETTTTIDKGIANRSR